jgi:hypothetical protein
MDVLDFCIAHNWSRVGLVGTSDLGEIAILCAHEHPIEFAGCIDPQYETPMFSGLRVYTSATEMKAVDAYVIVDLSSPQEMFDLLRQIIPSERILAPRLLNISRGAGPGHLP